MTVKDLYQEAIIHKHYSLLLLIDFLVNEKKVLKFEDDSGKINFYLEERFAEKMKALLYDYNLKRKLVPDSSTEKCVEVFRFRKDDTYYFVVAYSRDQAESYFTSKHGEMDELIFESPELQVVWEGKVITLKQIMSRTSKVPGILGSWKI